MKTVHKAIVAVVIMLVSMLIVPWIAVKLAEPTWGMSICLFMFFVINPFVSIALGLMAGTAIKRLWRIPPTMALLFPIFFALVVWSFVPELFIYSALYLGGGTAAMLGMYFGMKKKSQGGKMKDDIGIKKH